MWNFLVSGLSLGCTLVLYDGRYEEPHSNPTLRGRLANLPQSSQGPINTLEVHG